MIVEPFQPSHLAEIDLQPEQRSRVDFVTPEYAAMLAEGYALTLRHEGRILACAGVAEAGYGRGLMWSFLSTDSREHAVLMHRAALRFLSTVRLRRIEATVVSGFDRGCRWLTRLGFQHEGTMRAFGPDGADHELYARVT